MLVSPIEKIKLKTAQKYWKNEKMKQIASLPGTRFKWPKIS